MTSVPHRQVSDPGELRALAHPLRIRLMEELVAHGAQTASQLAELVGESPANCSWHLRLLQRYGFIEEAPGGTGRQRPWQMVLASRSWGTGSPEESPELALAGDEATRVLYRRELDAFSNWLSARRAEAAGWRESGFSNSSLAWLTAAELEEIGKRISEVLAPQAERFLDPAARPEGARLVRLIAWGVPSTSTPHEEK
ncbi:winged helix-turn-helix domain-containing protein [Longispora albida]|uniref:winged helix-turn-helix domain-containing protein n=1 Tax=Longispora albida TaxID=203523 RepID=UPI0003743EDF|nr:helix-turn-helix domain-containing protein [Longispora albida]